MREVVLRLKNIVKEFPTSKKNKKVHAVSDISLDIYENETLWEKADAANPHWVNVQ